MILNSPVHSHHTQITKHGEHTLRKQQIYNEASDIRIKDYEQRNSQHTMNLVLKSYSDDSVKVMVEMMFYDIHVVLTNFKK
jgi:hypothetical protein